MGPTHIPFLLSHISLYLLATPAGPLLVDTGAPGMLWFILRRLKHRHGLAPQDLAGVVLTHCHIDHCGGAAPLARLGVPIYAHERERPYLQGEAPLPGYGGHAGRALGWLERSTLGRRKALPSLRCVGDDEPLCGSQWRVVPAPGHSPGSIALWHPEARALLSGDTLNGGLFLPHGPHPLFTQDLPRARRSALSLLDLEPTTIYPGHGLPLDARRFAGVRRRLEAKVK